MLNFGSILEPRPKNALCAIKFDLILASSSSPRPKKALFDTKCCLMLASSSSPRPKNALFDTKCYSILAPFSSLRPKTALFIQLYVPARIKSTFYPQIECFCRALRQQILKKTTFEHMAWGWGQNGMNFWHMARGWSLNGANFAYSLRVELKCNKLTSQKNACFSVGLEDGAKMTPTLHFCIWLEDGANMELNFTQH